LRRIETQNHSDSGRKKKLQKERYRVFIEDVADGFYETNLQGDFLFFNDALCRIFGYARTHIQNRNFRTFMDKKSAEIAFERFNKIYKTEKRATDIVWEIIGSDGRTRVLEISANLIYDENGQKSGFRGIARDMTEKHLAQTEVKSLNRAKDRFIHHLSHELKTPVSVLAASLSVLNKKYVGREDKDLSRILNRAQRNLDRILDMQYEIEDILSQRDYKSYSLLSALLDACSDELELLAVEETGRLDIIPRIRRRIETLFGPRDYTADEIELNHFVAHKIKSLQHLFAHRQCRLETHFEPTPAISIPVEVLSKIVEGLIRNAVENTPDEGLIQVSVKNSLMGPELEIKDFGVGITAENRNLIFESYLTTHDTLQYSSRKPYDFYAGGKGFDLLRMKIFSEQYGFQIQMSSRRCIYIPGDEDLCPGKITKCRFCRVTEDCLQSGGTMMTVRFTAFKSKEKRTERAKEADGN